MRRKRHKFSIGAYQWIQLGMFCRYEMAWGATWTGGSCSFDDPGCEASGS